MTELSHGCARMFDVVVIDTPPLLPVTDAAVLASQTDGAVVVVRFGKTTKDQLGGAVDRLHAVDSAPLGIILNMVPTGRSGAYGYGYGYAPPTRTCNDPNAAEASGGASDSSISARRRRLTTIESRCHVPRVRRSVQALPRLCFRLPHRSRVPSDIAPEHPRRAEGHLRHNHRCEDCDRRRGGRGYRHRPGPTRRGHDVHHPGVTA